MKAALFNTRIPRLTTAVMDGGSVDLTLSDDIYDCERIAIDSIPVLVTLCKIGEHCVVDPSAEEEECSSATLVIGVACHNGREFVTTTRTTGAGSFHNDTLTDSLKLGVKAGECLNNELIRVLKLEEERKGVGINSKPIFGFLK